MLTRPRSFIIAILTFAFAILFAARVVEARAGGGHSFGGGGGHSFSGGHSFGNHGGSRGGSFRGTGGGEGGVSEAVVALIIIAIVVVIIISQLQKQQQIRTIRRGLPAADGLARASAMAELQRDDPAFDPVALCSAVAKAFTIVQSAWSAMKLDPIRPFVSDGVFERFTLQIQEMQAVGYRNVVEDLKILSVTIQTIENDDFFQTIALAITASARDYDVSLNNGTRLRTNSTSDFTEVWSFIRRRGTKTPAGGGFKLLEGNCPNCGASLEMNQHARCKQCSAIVRNGQYDWVLAEITQESEWDGRPQSAVPGLSAMRQRDPALNIQTIEDTASVIFYRTIAAGWARDSRPLRKMATDDFCRDYAATVGQSYYTNCGVGSVSVLGLCSDAGQDRAIVRITWSGTRHTGNSGQTYGGNGVTGVISQLFMLSRDATAMTDVNNAISSAHCPNCGGPMLHDASPACEFCGTVLNDGKHGWVLGAIYAASSSQGQAALQSCRQSPTTTSTASPASPSAPAARAAPAARGSEMLGWVLQTVLADGVVSEKEQQYLHSIAQTRRIPLDHLNEMIEAAKGGSLDVAAPADCDEARAWLEAMVEAGFADGRLTADEVKILQKLALAQGFTNQELNVLINSVRTRLLQQTRMVLRNSARA